MIACLSIASVLDQGTQVLGRPRLGTVHVDVDAIVDKLCMATPFLDLSAIAQV